MHSTVRTSRCSASSSARPPADEDAEHLLVRTVECIDGHVEMELVCEPAFAYGSTQAQWQWADGDSGAIDAIADDQTVRLHTDLRVGIEGSRVRARHTLSSGDRAFCSLSWNHDLSGPADADDAE